MALQDIEAFNCGYLSVVVQLRLRKVAIAYQLKAGLMIAVL